MRGGAGKREQEKREGVEKGRLEGERRKGGMRGVGEGEWKEMDYRKDVMTVMKWRKQERTEN